MQVKFVGSTDRSWQAIKRKLDETNKSESAAKKPKPDESAPAQQPPVKKEEKMAIIDEDLPDAAPPTQTSPVSPFALPAAAAASAPSPKSPLPLPPQKPEKLHHKEKPERKHEEEKKNKQCPHCQGPAHGWKCEWGLMKTKMKRADIIDMADDPDGAMAQINRFATTPLREREKALLRYWLDETLEIMRRFFNRSSTNALDVAQMSTLADIRDLLQSKLGVVVVPPKEGELPASFDRHDAFCGFDFDQKWAVATVDETSLPEILGDVKKTRAVLRVPQGIFWIIKKDRNATVDTMKPKAFGPIFFAQEQQKKKKTTFYDFYLQHYKAFPTYDELVFEPNPENGRRTPRAFNAYIPREQREV